MQGLPSTAEVDAHLAAASLREYAPMAWPIFEPATPFKRNWHIDCICEHLEAVSAGQLLRLIINIPPRHMKSSLVAVLWPTWEWLRNPATKWLYISYAEKLSKRDSLKCRRIIQSKGGRTTGGTLVEQAGYMGLLALLGEEWELAGDQNEKMRFENTRTGYRLATSIGGSATGEGGDILVIDDPNKAKDVESEADRQNVIDEIDGTLSTRLNDPATGRVVFVQQRVHENDATGHMLEQGGYHHLCLPAEYNPQHPFVYPDRVFLPERHRDLRDEHDQVIETVTIPPVELPGDPRTEPGQLLWPHHFDQAALADLRLRLGSYRAAGQLDQLPAPAEGGIFKTAWWQYYPPGLLARLDELLLDGEANPGRVCGLPHFTRLWQSWDTSLKEKTSSDYAAGQLWAQFGPDRYLLRAVRERMGLTETITQIKALADWTTERFPNLTPAVYIENKANGPEVIAAVRKQIQGVIPVNPSTDKVARAEAVTPQLEGGNVYLPGDRVMSSDGWRPDPTFTPAWVQDIISECATFPAGANDDQVDALTQALDPTRVRGTPAKARRDRGQKPITSRLQAGDV